MEFGRGGVEAGVTIVVQNHADSRWEVCTGSWRSREDFDASMGRAGDILGVGSVAGADAVFGGGTRGFGMRFHVMNAPDAGYG